MWLTHFYQEIFSEFLAIVKRKKMKVLVAQSCPTLCDPMNCSPPAFSVHEILQARILEWVAIPFSRGSYWPRDQTWVSCTAGKFLTIWAVLDPFMPGWCFLDPPWLFISSKVLSPKCMYKDTSTCWENATAHITYSPLRTCVFADISNQSWSDCSRNSPRGQPTFLGLIIN